MAPGTSTDRASTLDQQLRFAIANKRLIQFNYTKRSRVAEPHDYGLQGGAAKLLVYQIRGESRTPLPDWRLLFVAKIEELVVLPETFRGSRGHSHQRHKEWDELFARVG